MSNGNDEKILTLAPNGKKGVNISKSKYDAVREAIRSSLHERGSCTLAELNDQVESSLAGKFDGKIGWYLMAVKLDLEERGEITRIPNKVPQTLRLS